MALVPSVLVSGFAGLPTQTDAQAAADQFANVYNTYALAAQAGAVIPIFTGLEKTKFSSILYAQFQNPVGSAASAAQAFVDAITAFWAGPPVPFGTNPPPVPLGIVTTPPAGPALLSALTSLFSAPNDTNTFAAGLAAALDVATRTVVVTITAGGATFNLS